MEVFKNIMPMQIGLDELLSALLGRVEEMGLDSENQKSKFNIMFRALYKKGVFNDNDIIDSVKDENKILLKLGLIKEMPSDDVIKAAANNIMLWIKGDADEIKKSVEQFQQKLKEAEAEQNKPKIDVAPAAVLNELDRMNANKNNHGGLII